MNYEADWEQAFNKALFLDIFSPACLYVMFSFFPLFPNFAFPFWLILFPPSPSM